MINPMFRYLRRSSIGIPFAATMVAATMVVLPVVVDVLGGKRTVLDYILSPIERAQTIIFREK